MQKSLLETVRSYRESLGGLLTGNSSKNEQAAYHMACAVEWAILSEGVGDDDISECVLNHFAASLAFSRSIRGDSKFDVKQKREAAMREITKCPS
jgi:hypothetical protein